MWWAKGSPNSSQGGPFAAYWVFVANLITFFMIMEYDGPARRLWVQALRAFLLEWKALVMKVFRLYVHLGEKWEMACSVVAENPEKALQEAKLLLKPEHRGKPLLLRAENEPPPTEGA